MTSSNWAENEVKKACERENPDWDGASFDYGCSCYQSALKAYKSLIEDGHSGYSFTIAKSILERLMDNLPLVPVTDEDFDMSKGLGSGNDWLNEMGLRYDIPCSRMSSLFKRESLSGVVSYLDVNRVRCIDIHHKSSIFSNGTATSIVDKLYPIKLPYFPRKGIYKVYVEEFLADKNNGDFDTQGFLYLITPDGDRVELNTFYTEKGNKMVEITKEEYEDMKSKTIIYEN